MNNRITLTAQCFFLPVCVVAAASWCAAMLVTRAIAEPVTVELQTTSPAPKFESKEAAYRAKLDSALEPILDIKPSASDAAQIKNAAAAIKAANLSRFSEAANAISDPVARKLATWIRLRAGYGDASEFKQFLKDNPLWPERSTLTQRMEEALFTQGGSAASIKSYFTSSEPQTGIGFAALASAYQAEGNTAEAKKLAAKAWRDMTLPGTLETGFLNRFGSLLTEADHKWRFDRMVTDDVRWAGNRADRVAFARRVIPLLSPAEQKKAQARLAVFNKSSNAASLMAAVPDDDGRDVGLAFHRVQLLRKAGKYEQAAKIILAMPPDPDKIAVLDEWWAERRQLAYLALKAGRPKLAYDLAKDAGPLSVNPLKEQTFMAGWIAWRYLKDADAAEKHFTALEKAADGPLSRAKAAYWHGRLAESRGDKGAAAEHYRNATRDPDTFHGLLAMQKLEPARRSLEVKPPDYPTDAQIKNFLNSDAVKAAAIANAALSREYTRGFLTSLRIGLPSEAEAAMVAHLADMFGDTQMSVRVAKAAIARGQNLLTYGYPVHTFPSFRTLRKPPEMAFMLGITRQETEFEPQTLSGAGAKGLMQVMTVTAKHVCSDHKIKCDIQRLMSDTSYNAQIASAYIADRMEEFDGSYVLGLAGYNAGPGRARQWIRENGDPRDAGVDPVDWIERIPITETREYVTKVLSNIQIYRARLGGEANALRISQDLKRAQGSHKEPGAADGEGGDATPRADNSEG